MEGQNLEIDSLKIILADLFFGKLLCTSNGAHTIFEDHWYTKTRQI